MRQRSCATQLEVVEKLDGYVCPEQGVDPLPLSLIAKLLSKTLFWMSSEIKLREAAKSDMLR